MRLHPVVYGPFLQSAEDDILPLSKPIKTLDGKFISTLPVGKGQVIHMSISGYNRYSCHFVHEFPIFFNKGLLIDSGTFGGITLMTSFPIGGFIQPMLTKMVPPALSAFTQICGSVNIRFEHKINYVPSSGNFVSGAQSCLG